jgi:hypothetical protein
MHLTTGRLREWQVKRCSSAAASLAAFRTVLAGQCWARAWYLCAATIGAWGACIHVPHWRGTLVHAAHLERTWWGSPLWGEQTAVHLKIHGIAQPWLQAGIGLAGC